VIGTTTNDSAAAGSVGELISSVIASGSSVTFTSGANHDLTSISLTAGDWDVWGNIRCGGTTVTALVGWIGTATATTPNTSLITSLTLSSPNNQAAPVPSLPMQLAGTTTIYLSGLVLGTGTLSVCGGIYARRRR
jgi:hypothetical protein